MPTGLDQDQNKQLMDWIAQNGSDPRGTSTAVAAPQPPVPASPALAPTDKGSAEESNDTTSQDERIQDSHPGHQPDDLLATETADKMAQASKFGPDQEKALMESINKNEGSIQNRLSRGAAGLGDAIMGVAGKSGPGFLNNLQQREESQNKRAMEMLPTLQGMNEKQMAQKQALEGQGANTPLAQAKRAALLPYAQKFFPGKTPKEYQAMLKLPDDFAKMLPIPADVYGKEVEAKMKASELNIQGKRADVESKRVEAEMGNQALQRQEEEQRIKGSALSSLGKMGPIDRLLHPDVSKGLSEQAGLNGSSHGIPDLGSTFNGHKVTGVKRIK